MELMPPDQGAGRSNRRIADQGRLTVAEVHLALGETGDVAKQSKHAMGFG
jgi:hypothetical protein